MDVATDREIESRIKIARRYKHETQGAGHISGSLFGEPDEPLVGKYSKQWAGYDKREAARIAQWANRKHVTGGIVGVMYDSTHTRRKNRFRAVHPDGSRTYHDCAVEAAEARNLTFSEVYPGLDVAQCDVAAVKRKWGCNCGKHGRAKA